MTSPDQMFVDSALAERCFPGCGTLSFGNVLTKLAKKCAAFQKRLENGERVLGVEVEEMSATNGFTSHVFRCTIQMEAEQKKMEPFGLIVKAFAMDRLDSLMENFVGRENFEELQRDYAKMNLNKNGENSAPTAAVEQHVEGQQNVMFHQQWFCQMHKNECHFYDFIGCADGQNPPLPLPTVWHTQLVAAGAQDGQGLILMEDLTDESHLLSFSDGLNEEQIFDIAKHLAHLHAHVLSLNDGDWKHLFMTAEELFSDQQQEGQDPNKMMNMFIGQLGEHKEKFLVPLGRMQKMLGGMEACGKWARQQLKEKYGISETLVHGDLWINNLLWHNTQPNRVAAFIDWQLCMRGNPMTDFARLLLMNTDPDIRHGLEANGRLMGVYLDALNGALKEKGLEPVGYAVEELECAYALAGVRESLCCIFVIPLFSRVWAETPDFERKIGRLLDRASAAMADTVCALERVAPEWVVPLEELGKEKTVGNEGN